MTELIGELRSGALAVDQDWLNQHFGDSDKSDAESGTPLAVQAPKPGRAKTPSKGGPELKVHQGGSS